MVAGARNGEALDTQVKLEFCHLREGLYGDSIPEVSLT
jgi:hypothetical protein